MTSLYGGVGRISHIFNVKGVANKVSKLEKLTEEFGGYG